MTRSVREPERPCVLLVEDSPELAKSMSRSLQARGFAVMLATNRAHAAALIEREDLCFDAAVLDHHLPDGDSRELVTALANRDPSCCSIVLTSHGGRELVRDYLQRGAFRYAAKPISGTQLVILVTDTVHHTRCWRRSMSIDTVGVAAREPPPLAVIPDFGHAAERLGHIAGLTRIETTVAYWMLQGLRDVEIGEKLARTERTAKRHVSRVLAKLGIKNRASLWAVLGADAGTPNPDHEENERAWSGSRAPHVAP